MFAYRKTSDCAPIALFAYNRPSHLESTLRSLSDCECVSDSPLRIFIDGPRNDAVAEDVRRVREVAHEFRHADKKIIAREKNFGLRRSIYEGVRQNCEEFGRTIVLEDDFVLSPVVLRFFNQQLNAFSEDSRVYSVCGYISTIPDLQKIRRPLLLPTAHPWGWATWADRWSGFSPEQSTVDERLLASSTFRERMNVHGLRDYHAMLLQALAGRIDSWFVYWQYYIASNNGMSIFPSCSYVHNRGMDGSGTHAGRFNFMSNLVGPSILSTEPLNAVVPEGCDAWAIDLLKRCREVRAQRIVDRLGRIKRRLL